MHSDNINEFLNKNNSEHSTMPPPSINTGQNNEYWIVIDILFSNF